MTGRSIFLLGGTVVALLLGATACRTTVGQTSMWIRPSTGTAQRSMENGDGEQIVMEEFRPEGDSFMIMLRFYPMDDEKPERFTNHSLRDWPKKLREKFKLDK